MSSCFSFDCEYPYRQHQCNVPPERCGARRSLKIREPRDLQSETSAEEVKKTWQGQDREELLHVSRVKCSVEQSAIVTRVGWTAVLADVETTKDGDDTKHQTKMRHLARAIAAKLSKAWALTLPVHNQAEDSILCATVHLQNSEHSVTDGTCNSIDLDIITPVPSLCQLKIIQGDRQVRIPNLPEHSKKRQ